MSILNNPPPVLPALQLKQVSHTLGHSLIINQVSLSIMPRERHALIGPNGAGKTTLFNLISGRHQANSGTIWLNQQNITQKPPYKINRLGLSRSFQITHIFGQLTAFENLECAVLWRLGYGYSFWHGLKRLKTVQEQASQMLEQIGLSARHDTLAATLSYAEQRFLEIGMTALSGSSVILLDEPTAGMSRSESSTAIALVRTLTHHKTLLMVEHDMAVVFELADRITVLVNGKIIASNTPEKIRQNPIVQAAYLGG